MRRSVKWNAIKIDGDIFIEGFLGLKWCPSDTALAARNRWENAVDRIITQLSAKHTSYHVMNALHKSGRIVVIEPMTEEDCSARVVRRPENDETIRDSSRAGTAALDCNRPANFRKFDNMGTGKGTDTTIKFSPSDWRRGGCDAKGVGRDKDEVLIHELVHAMRMMRGLSNHCHEASIAGFSDQEEFISVVISNVYSSETNRRLRKDHTGFDPLPRTSSLRSSKDPDKRVEVSLQDPQQFCNWFRPQLEEFAKHQGGLARQLAKLNWIKWNPFRFL